MQGCILYRILNSLRYAKEEYRDVTIGQSTHVGDMNRIKIAGQIAEWIEQTAEGVVNINERL